ncbi:unnamed protein product [Owenia fusiformis]|uniref:Uncharacterized protein n=1 Tax=Owenia fusiformis TaxID=6347 RepID=A0A8J1TLB1_OWEFU|nr:unnamed protein product [Owenia fusiformis]
MFSTILIISAAIIHVCYGQVSPCSKTNRASDLDACLNEIRTIAQNDDWFWYGRSYFTLCPEEKRQEIGCLNNDADPNRLSLADKMFTKGTFDPMALDRYIDAAYVSPPGQYMGCDHLYVTENTTSFEIDPILNTTHNPWSLRILPDMSWTSNADDYFTLLVIDTSNGIRHGIFINIKESNMSTAEVIKKYHGPMNPTSKENVYAFILLKQNAGNMSLGPGWAEKIAASMIPMNISNFITEHGLQGPIALNWMKARNDPYSVTGAFYIENCVPFIQERAIAQNRPFLKPDMSLDVRVDISFTSEPIAFTSCCNDYNYPLRSFKLDPIGDGITNAAEVRTGGSSRTYDLKMRKLGPNPSDFIGIHYSLVMIDPDVPAAQVGNKSHPLLHMIVMNIPMGNVSNGEVMVSYNGPMPPDQLPHTYYYLLYKQQGALNTSIWGSYAGNCPERLAGRCLWDIERFVTENSLMLSGATWMRTFNDAYVNHTKIVAGGDEDEFCVNSPNYPCPTSGTAFLGNSLELLFSVIFLFSIYIQ